MARITRGKPVWYELATPSPAASAAFYHHVLGWSVADANMPGFDYRLAASGDDLVAGIMPGDAPLWGVYFTVPSCDNAVRAVEKAGGTVQQPATDIPGTGRFALVTDPQGAALGLLQPLDSDGKAYAAMQAGHGCWHELMTSDPEAALGFYGKVLNWKAGDAMDMGAMGTYQIFRHGKADIGGIMRQGKGMPGPDHPFWLPYFGTDSVAAAMARTAEAGGTVLHGPHQVPGGAFIMVGRDTQGAVFALVGGA